MALATSKSEDVLRSHFPPPVKNFSLALQTYGMKEPELERMGTKVLQK